jgi:hypothetical protein
MDAYGVATWLPYTGAEFKVLAGEGQCGTGEHSSKRNKRKSGEPGGGSENKGQKSPKRMKIVAETQSRRRAKEKIQETLQTNFAAVRLILIEDQKSGPRSKEKRGKEAQDEERRSAFLQQQWERKREREMGQR